jgi:hypothetical protein
LNKANQGKTAFNKIYLRRIVMCKCGCQTKKNPPPEQQENKTYVCIQCNTFKSVVPNDPAPECCGKKMNEMD